MQTAARVVFPVRCISPVALLVPTRSVLDMGGGRRRQPHPHNIILHKLADCIISSATGLPWEYLLSDVVAPQDIDSHGPRLGIVSVDTKKRRRFDCAIRRWEGGDDCGKDVAFKSAVENCGDCWFG
jgi:hypothetical protein